MAEQLLREPSAVGGMTSNPGSAKSSTASQAARHLLNISPIRRVDYNLMLVLNTALCFKVLTSDVQVQLNTDKHADLGHDLQSRVS